MVVRGAPEWWVKLADFGLSKRLVNRETFTSNGGTKPYMAPELRCGSYLGTSSRGYTYAVDLWAMGCIAYRLVAGAVPFPPEYDLTEFCRDESLFPLQHLIESNVGDSCRSFIKALLTTSPTDRPSAAEALNHNWIKPANSTGWYLLVRCNMLQLTRGIPRLHSPRAPGACFKSDPGTRAIGCYIFRH